MKELLATLLMALACFPTLRSPQIRIVPKSHRHTLIYRLLYLDLMHILGYQAGRSAAARPGGHHPPPGPPWRGAPC